MAASKDDKESRRRSARNAGLAVGAKDVVQNHGEAVNIWVEGYTGDGGNVQGLRQMHAWKRTDPRNTPQQAGKAGEVLHKTRTNADNAMAGRSERVARDTDISGKYDQTFDIMDVDASGQPVQAGGKVQGAQMKLGETPENTVNQILNKKGLEKYAGAQEILVPADQVKAVKDSLAGKAAEQRRLAERARERGRHEAAAVHEAKAQRLEQAGEKVKPAKVKTQQEAEQALLNPKMTTAKGVADAANKAGLKAAKTGAMLGAGISGAQNVLAVVKGEKGAGEAVVDTAVDTAKAAAVSYATAAAGSLVKSGAEQAAKRVASQAGKSLLKGMAKGNAPALIVTSTLEVGKSLTRYARGEIDGGQLAVELGEKAAGITAATYGAEAGAIAGAWIGGIVGSVVPVLGNVAGAAAGGFIGGVVGSMVGYMVSSQIYQAVGRVLAQPGINAARRAELMAISQQAQESIRREREELERLMDQYYAERSAELRGYFEGLRDAILAEDARGLTAHLDKITAAFGGSLQYQDDDEFEAFMLDGSKPVKLRLT